MQLSSTAARDTCDYYNSCTCSSAVRQHETRSTITTVAHAAQQYGSTRHVRLLQQLHMQLSSTAARDTCDYYNSCICSSAVRQYEKRATITTVAHAGQQYGSTRHVRLLPQLQMQLSSTASRDTFDYYNSSTCSSAVR